MPATPDDAVRAVAARYDDGAGEGAALAEEALARLAALRGRGKECGGCGERKPVSAFGMDSRERDGLHRHCRVCRGTGPVL